jgi:hypothetical protein
VVKKSHVPQVTVIHAAMFLSPAGVYRIKGRGYESSDIPENRLAGRRIARFRVHLNGSDDLSIRLAIKTLTDGGYPAGDEDVTSDSAWIGPDLAFTESHGIDSGFFNWRRR